MMQQRFSWVGALVWIAAGVGMLAVLHTVFWYESGQTDFSIHYQQADRVLGIGEMRLYLMMLLFGLPAGACIVHGTNTLLRDKLRAKRSSSIMASWAAGLWLPTVVAALLTFLIAHFVVDYAWFTDDEQAYLLQAKLYAQGRLTMPRPEPDFLLNHAFVVEVLAKNDVPQVTGVYPPLQPFLIALSGMLGYSHLSQVFCVGFITYQTGRLAQRLFGAHIYGLVAAWLCATSPLLLGLGATLHTSILATALSVTAFRLGLWTHRRGGLVPGLALGFVGGLLVAGRPLEGALVLGLSGATLLLGVITSLRGNQDADGQRNSLFKSLLGFGLGALLPLVVLGIINVELTGHPLHGAYFVMEQKIGRFMGFGQGMMWGRIHSPEIGSVQTVTALVRVNAFAFGWPLSLGLAVLSAFPPFRRRITGALLGVIVLHLGAYFPLAFGSVHDFGHAYHVWQLPLISTLSAWVLVRGAQSRHSLYAVVWQKLPAFACAMAVVAVGFFWPLEIQRWHEVSEAIWSPVRAVQSKRVEGEPTLVLWNQIQPPGSGNTWVFRAPTPDPDGQFVWARDVRKHYPLLRQHFPHHTFLRLTWNGQQPVVVRLDP